METYRRVDTETFVSNTEDAARRLGKRRAVQAEGERYRSCEMYSFRDGVASMNNHAGTVRASLPGSKRPGPVLTKLSAVENSRLAAAPVKRSLRGGLRSSRGWSELERERVSDIRVEIRFTGNVVELPQRGSVRPARVQAQESRSILRVILERTRSLCNRLRAHSSEGRRV